VRHDEKARDRWASTIGHFLGETEALRTLTYLGAWKADQKLDVRAEAANVKLFATELLHRVIDLLWKSPGHRDSAKIISSRERFVMRARPALSKVRRRFSDTLFNARCFARVSPG
jgi:hypothetical protein